MALSPLILSLTNREQTTIVLEVAPLQMFHQVETGLMAVARALEIVPAAETTTNEAMKEKEAEVAVKVAVMAE